MPDLGQGGRKQLRSWAGYDEEEEIAAQPLIIIPLLQVIQIVAADHKTKLLFRMERVKTLH